MTTKIAETVEDAGGRSEMKEHTITKTLFKIEEKKKSNENYTIEGFGTVLLWGQIREMDLVTFASVLWTQNDGNFAVLSPVICPLSSLSSLFFCVFLFFVWFHFG